MKFAGVVAIWPVEHHSSSRSMNRESAVQSGAAVQTREAARPDAFERRAGVQQGHQSRPCAREVRRQQQRILLAHNPIDGVRSVGPVHEDADDRIVDRSELGDCLVWSRQVSRDDVGERPSFFNAATSCSVVSRDCGKAHSLGLAR